MIRSCHLLTGREGMPSAVPTYWMGQTSCISYTTRRELANLYATDTTKTTTLYHEQQGIRHKMTAEDSALDTDRLKG